MYQYSRAKISIASSVARSSVSTGALRMSDDCTTDAITWPAALTATSGLKLPLFGLLTGTSVRVTLAAARRCTSAGSPT